MGKGGQAPFPFDLLSLPYGLEDVHPFSCFLSALFLY